MYKVLLVDDIESNLKTIKRLLYWRLKEGAFEIAYEASNGQEALEILNSNNVDVMITDIFMPVMDGMELLKEVKKNKLCPCTIISCELEKFSYAKQGIIYGAFDYLVKPIDEKNITETFGRAQQYLDSLYVSSNPLEGYCDILTRSILEGDQNKAVLLSKKITKEFLSLYREDDDYLFAVSNLLKKVKDGILRKRKYFSLYIPFDELTTITKQNLRQIGREKLFVWCVEKICKEMKVLYVPEYSKNVKKLCTIALSQVDEKICLNNIAADFFMNAKYLGALFKKETGINYVQYTTRLKIYRSKMLLRNKNLSICEIANQTGFKDVAYFSKVFKRETGETPTSFRRRNS